jgi:hypothetical protein
MRETPIAEMALITPMTIPLVTYIKNSAMARILSVSVNG